LPFVAGVILVVAAIGVGIWALNRGGAPSGASSGASKRPVRPPHTAPPQAKWKVDTFPAGALGKVSKAEAKAIAKTRPALTRIVTDTFNALLLVPNRYRDVVTSYFIKPASASLLHTRLAPPKGAEDVRTTLRRARIGVEVAGANRAAALVKVKAKAKDSGRRIAWKTRTILWLDKLEGHWKVVGFDVSQLPTRHHKGRHHGGPGHKSHKGKKSHEGKNG
jgi:hypothetical protein